MKAVSRMYLKTVCWPLAVIAYVVVLLCVLAPVNSQYIVFGLKKSQELGAVNYVAFSRWLLMICAPILVNGWYLERSKKIKIFVILRMKRRTQFKLFLIFGCMFNSAIWALVICIAVMVRFGAIIAAEQLLLLLPNLLLWSSVMVFLYLMQRGAAWSGLLCIGIIGGTYLIGEYLPALDMFMPSLWGMVYRSNIYINTGWSVVYMMIMSTLMCLIFVFVLIHHGLGKSNKPRCSIC